MRLFLFSHSFSYNCPAWDSRSHTSRFSLLLILLSRISYIYIIDKHDASTRLSRQQHRLLYVRVCAYLMHDASIKNTILYFIGSRHSCVADTAPSPTKGTQDPVTWSQLWQYSGNASAEPTPRAAHSMVLSRDERYLYIFGGVGDDEDSVKGDLWQVRSS